MEIAKSEIPKLNLTLNLRRADLGADEERAITSKLDIPVFSMNYPIELKPFYHKPDPKDEKHVLCNNHKYACDYKQRAKNNYSVFYA